MEKRKSVEMKKIVQQTEGISEDAEYKFFMNSLRSLFKDPSFVKFRKVLEDIAKFVDKVYENWKKSRSRNQRLELELASNVSKIKAALQLSEEDKNTIDTLKEELEKAWKIADELRTKPSMTSIKRQSSFPDFESIRSEKFRFPINKIDAIERQSYLQQAKTIEDLKGEKNKLEMRLKDVDSLLKDKNDYSRQLESKLKKLEEQIISTQSSVSEDIHNMTVELESSRLRVFELEEEIANKEKCIEELIEQNENKMKDIVEKDTEICLLKEQMPSLEENEQIQKKVSMSTMTDSVDALQDDRPILEARVLKTVQNDQKNRGETKELKEKLSEKIKLLTEVEQKNQILSHELRVKFKTCQDLNNKYTLLRDQVKKCIGTVRELEQTRDKNVCTVGHLELETYELKRELVELKHCKYPEVIERLNKELRVLRSQMEERDRLVKCKKLQESAIAEKNVKALVSKIRKEMRIALQLIETFTNQNYVSNSYKFDSGTLSTPITDHENVEDLLSRFNGLVNYLVGLCKVLTTENHTLSAELEKSQQLKQAGPNELGIIESSQVYNAPIHELSGQGIIEAEKASSTLAKEFTKTEFDKSGQGDNVTEKASYLIDDELANEKHQEPIGESNMANTQNSDLFLPSEESFAPAKHRELKDLLKNSRLKKDSSIRQLSRRKSQPIASTEWKTFKDQVTLKSNKLHAMEENIEILNSKSSGGLSTTAIRKLKTTDKAPLSVQQSGLANIKRSFKSNRF